MNETIKKFIIIFGIIGILVLLFLFWYLGIFSKNNTVQKIQEITNPVVEKKPLTKDQQKEVLKELAPAEKLTDAQKKEQKKMLENLSKQKPKNEDAKNILNSLNNKKSEEEQLKILESLKK